MLETDTAINTSTSKQNLWGNKFRSPFRQATGTITSPMFFKRSMCRFLNAFLFVVIFHGSAASSGITAGDYGQVHRYNVLKRLYSKSLLVKNRQLVFKSGLKGQKISDVLNFSDKYFPQD